MKTTEIKLVQVPVIQHQLTEVGKSVTTRIDGLNVDNLVATDETIQALKKMRIELNKELTEFEAQRKTLKTAIANPYTDFENVYKVEVSEKYKGAIDILKTKIGEFETKVKKEKQAEIETYFKELCIAEGTDFLKFADTKIEVNLSTSVKKYKEQCNEFVQHVADDILLIQAQDNAAEIMAEYKANGLSASKAITDITARKEAERLEAERLRQAETDRRCTMLRNLAFVYHQITKTYNWVQDENVLIEEKEIQSLSPDEWNKRFVELENATKSKQAPVQSVISTPVAEAPQQQAAAPQQADAPLQAPIEEKPAQQAKIVKAKFEAEGTFPQLKSLGRYMKDNGITYKNL